ncbi:hypothetical protein SKAU_G00357360 [Synaphobranchus kaupii]|uniref:Uncharacterized protein n=1 Tax=Synaphobranchus kaupii TaxID=118154 RepID=A0A9Q1EHQ0_SYNKA|nr:hypothetical protein SKAU_G00357360 [Synaphobranchus kaupii]
MLLILVIFSGLLSCAFGQCDMGWREYENKCYFFSADVKSWHDALTDCEGKSSSLMSILDIHERTWVRTQIGTEIFWIGLNDIVTEGVWEWTDGSVYYPYLEYWRPGQPDNWADNEDCGQVAGGSNGQWNDEPCGIRRRYICKRPNPNPPTTCDTANGWQQFSSNCYKLKADTRRSWGSARHDCVRDGGDLVSIESAEEELYVTGRLDPSAFDLWTGYSTLSCTTVSCQVQADNEQFRWSDASSASYTNWGTGQPDLTDKANGVCSAVIKEADQDYGKWRSHVCRHERPYMCKRGLDNKDQDGTFQWVDKTAISYSNWNANFPRNTQTIWDCGQIYTAHMTRSSWLGLNDIDLEETYVWSDGQPVIAELLIWDNNQPDNWQDNEDCMQVQGVDHINPGYLNDQFCTTSFPFICKKAKGTSPPPPPTSGPGWNEKCGTWVSDPFNDYCYLFSYLSFRNWVDARTDCVNQGGDLISITEPFEQSFIQAQVQQIATGVAMWMGGHDSVAEGGWEWTDSSPFRYINWAGGNPDNYYGEDCLSMLINSGYWNDDNCAHRRGYICKRRGYITSYTCELSSTALHCPHNSIINIRAAFFGRNSDTICPYEGETSGTCTVEGFLPLVRKTCDNRPFCFLYAHTENDPCPDTSKYLEVVYSCEQNVCVRGLGLEDGNVTDAQLSASSSRSGMGPQKARLNGDSCWMPLTPTNSWIQVDLGEAKKVTGITIQGCPGADHWVTTFKVQSSTNEIEWTDYTEDGGTFPGSVDKTTPEMQLFGTPFSAQYIRVLPLGYNGQVGLRLDILGCKPNYAVSCSAKPSFSAFNDQMTVHCPSGCASQPYSVYGSQIYRGDSTICAAAIHAGIVLNEYGGDCTLLKQPGKSSYPGSRRNGITSKQDAVLRS